MVSARRLKHFSAIQHAFIICNARILQQIRSQWVFVAQNVQELPC